MSYKKCKFQSAAITYPSALICAILLYQYISSINYNCEELKEKSSYKNSIIEERSGSYGYKEVSINYKLN